MIKVLKEIPVMFGMVFLILSPLMLSLLIVLVLPEAPVLFYYVWGGCGCMAVIRLIGMIGEKENAKKPKNR